jgi:hypothetical protein
MSSEEEEAIMNSLDKKWTDKRTKAFIGRMEHKLNRKERLGRY